MSEAKHEAGEEKKSSKKKLIIIIVAVLVLLAGGGGAAFYFLKADPAKAKGEHAEKTKGKEGHGDEEKSAEHGEEADSAEHGDGEGEGDAEHGDGEVRIEMIYYDMGKPFVVSLPQGSGAKLISVAVAVSVEDAEAEAALKKHEPMIRNNLMMLIGSQKPEQLKTREGKEQLRADMLKAIIDILKKKIGKAHVAEVFFTSFVMQ